MGFRPVIAPPTFLRGYYNVAAPGNVINNNSFGNFDWSKVLGDDIFDLTAPAAPVCLYTGFLSAAYQLIGPNSVAAGVGIGFGLTFVNQSFTALDVASTLINAHNNDLNDIGYARCVHAVEAGWTGAAYYDRGNDGGGPYPTGPLLVTVSQLVF